MAAKQPKSAQQQQQAEIPLATEQQWEQAKGQEYGGSAGILKLEPGQIAGPLVYHGHQQITTELGDTTVHLGSDEDNEQWRLPISATFVRAMDQANLRPGDKFLTRRLPDQTKKRGKGAGNPMAMYAIKVIERSVVAGDGKDNVPF